MAYSGNLLTIDGTTIANLKTYKVTYAKLWSNAERNMAGDVRATLIGIFPKLELEIGGNLTENAVSTIAALLNKPYFSVTYFDPKSKTTKTAEPVEEPDPETEYTSTESGVSADNNEADYSDYEYDDNYYEDEEVTYGDEPLSYE